MNTHAMKLITIVCEAYALESVKSLLRDAGAHGWTHFPVEGAGAGGERAGETKEFANVRSRSSSSQSRHRQCWSGSRRNSSPATA